MSGIHLLFLSYLTYALLYLLIIITGQGSMKWRTGSGIMKEKLDKRFGPLISYTFYSYV